MKFFDKKYITVLIIIFFSFSVFSQKNDMLYQKAYAEYLKENFKTAINMLNDNNIPEYKQDKYYMLKADSYYKLKDYDNAISFYKKAFKLKNKTAPLKIAECYAEKSEPEKSAEYLKLYLKNKDKLFQSEINKIPAFAKIENSKAWINIRKEKHYSSYETKLDEARYLISKQNYAEAFDILDKLIIKNQKRHKAYEIRGDIFMLTEDYKAAANSYFKASEIKKQNITYKTKAANAFFLAGKYKKADKIYDEILSDRFFNPEILLKKAENDIKLKKYDEASQNLTFFMSLFPENPKALYLSGKLHYINGEYINALEYYNRCLQQDGSHPEYFISAGDTYIKTKTYESAVSNYSMALDLNPKLPEVWYKKGIAEIKLYKYENACKDLKKAKSMNYNKADDYLIKYCK